MDKPIIEFRNVTMAFRRLRRHYGLKATLLHPIQLARGLAEAAEFKAELTDLRDQLRLLSEMEACSIRNIL